MTAIVRFSKKKAPIRTTDMKISGAEKYDEVICISL